MNYIYDIVLNFQNYYYEFYEWKKEDKIKNIKKIPLYKVSNKDFSILKNNKIIIDNNFINKIKENNNKNICIVSNTTNAIALLFNNKGTLLKRSSLIFEEEEEANEYAKKLTITKLNYIKNIKVKNRNKLRCEIEKKDKLIKYINNSKDLISLKYLYFEYFEKECNNIKNIKEELLKEINKDWNIKQNNLYNLIKILDKNTLTK